MALPHPKPLFESVRPPAALNPPSTHKVASSAAEKQNVSIQWGLDGPLWQRESGCTQLFTTPRSETKNFL
jgi:hypothetical protein